MSNNGWDDLIRAVTVMILVVVVGTPLGLALGYFLHPGWYVLAAICGIPGVVFLWQRYVSKPDPIPAPPEDPPSPAPEK